jgi:hypothetical protein
MIENRSKSILGKRREIFFKGVLKCFSKGVLKYFVKGRVYILDFPDALMIVV